MDHDLQVLDVVVVHVIAGVQHREAAYRVGAAQADLVADVAEARLEDLLEELVDLFAERRLLPQEKEKARVPGPFALDSRSRVESSDVGPTPNPDADASSANSSSEARIERCQRRAVVQRSLSGALVAL